MVALVILSTLTVLMALGRLRRWTVMGAGQLAGQPDAVMRARARRCPEDGALYWMVDACMCGRMTWPDIATRRDSVPPVPCVHAETRLHWIRIRPHAWPEGGGCPLPGRLHGPPSPACEGRRHHTVPSASLRDLRRPCTRCTHTHT